MFKSDYFLSLLTPFIIRWMGYYWVNIVIWCNNACIKIFIKSDNEFIKSIYYSNSLTGHSIKVTGIPVLYFYTWIKDGNKNDKVLPDPVIGKK